MKKEVYEQLWESLHSVDELHEKALETRVSYNTLISILSQKYQVITMQTKRAHDQRKDEYVERYRKGHRLLTIAEDVNLAPCLLARMVMEEGFRLSKPDINSCINADRSLILHFTGDERLYREVEECVERDPFYSPSIERTKLAVGREYEYILQEILRNRNMPFVSEEELRRQGCVKTPDVKLTVPIDVNGHVVNWIDSKALFGTEWSHNHSIEQFSAYVNYFGPGMVIYWFDFLETLQGRPEGVLLVSEFPTHITLLSESSCC